MSPIYRAKFGGGRTKKTPEKKCKRKARKYVGNSFFILPILFLGICTGSHVRPIV